MEHDTGLRFAAWLAEAEAVRVDLAVAVAELAEDAGGSEIEALRQDIGGLVFHGAEPGAPPLTIGFVGPYSAGKSSLLRCLTGRCDLEVRADPVSHGFETYDWRGLRFLDTPGIEGGRKDHERAAAVGIGTSDLIIFVVTPNLFDDATASALRRIAGDDRRAPDILVVLNKAVSMGGDQALVLGELLQVAEPLGIERSAVVTTEARDWLDSEQEEDSELAAALRARSGIPELVAAVDGLAVMHGLTARLTRPLHAMRRIAGDAAAAVAAVDSDAERALHLLRRKIRLLSASEAKLRSAVHGMFSRVAEEILGCGDSTASAVVMGASPDTVTGAYKAAVARAEAFVDSLPGLVEKEIAREWAALTERLQHDQQVLVANGDMLQQIARRPTPRAFRSGFFGPAPSMSRAPSRSDAGHYVEQIRKFGSFLAEHSSGTRAGSGFLKTSGAAGSNAHKLIYEAGKLVGVKFKPYQAVRYAKFAGNAGRVLGVVGGLLGMALAFHEQKQEREADEKVSSAREEIRKKFREYARRFEQAGEDSFNQVADMTYGAEQRAALDERERIVHETATRTERATPFLAIAARADKLASQIAAADESGINTRP